MHITERTIQQFFDNECSAAEAEAVAAYLEQHPEVLDRYLAGDWKDDETKTLSADESSLLLHAIKQQAGIRGAKLKWLLTASAVAASVILAVCASWLLTAKKEMSLLAQVTPAIQPQKQWIVRSNLTKTQMSLQLEDQSVVKLQPQAIIKYAAFKGENKRDVCLSGESFFKVAKDKTKPFTVFAGGVATTAVGTEFSVAEKNGRITVKLFEGKVRIKAAKPLPGWKKNELYLMPGEEFIYDKANALFEVRAIPKTHKAEPLNEKVYAKAIPRLNESTVSATANWYMFNNQSLNNVFSQLEEIYNVKIEYKTADVKNVYLIGRFEKTDSLVGILNNIALLKKLKIRHTGNTYFVSKK